MRKTNVIILLLCILIGMNYTQSKDKGVFVELLSLKEVSPQESGSMFGQFDIYEIEAQVVNLSSDTLKYDEVRVFFYLDSLLICKGSYFNTLDGRFTSLFQAVRIYKDFGPFSSETEDIKVNKKRREIILQPGYQYCCYSFRTSNTDYVRMRGRKWFKASIWHENKKVYQFFNRSIVETLSGYFPCINETQKSNYEDSNVYYTRGLSYLRTAADTSGHLGPLTLIGLYEQANHDFSKAIKLNPQNAMAFFYRGIAQKWLIRHEEALSDFDNAVLLCPDYSQAYYHRATILDMLGNWHEAVINYEIFLEKSQLKDGGKISKAKKRIEELTREMAK